MGTHYISLIFLLPPFHFETAPRQIRATLLRHTPCSSCSVSISLDPWLPFHAACWSPLLLIHVDPRVTPAVTVAGALLHRVRRAVTRPLVNSSACYASWSIRGARSPGDHALLLASVTSPLHPRRHSRHSLRRLWLRLLLLRQPRPRPLQSRWPR